LVKTVFRSGFGREGREGDGELELRRRFPIEDVISRWGFLEQYLHLHWSLPSPMSQRAWGMNSGTERKRDLLSEPCKLLAESYNTRGKHTKQVYVVSRIVSFAFVVVEHAIAAWKVS
jgi:hypothetical protein